MASPDVGNGKSASVHESASELSSVDANNSMRVSRTTPDRIREDSGTGFFDSSNCLQTSGGCGKRRLLLR
jgi:hypothetical protein